MGGRLRVLVVVADDQARARVAAIAAAHQVDVRTVDRGADVPPAVDGCDVVCLDPGALAQLVDGPAPVAPPAALTAALRISALGGGAMALSGVARSTAAAFGAAGAALWEGDLATAAIHGVSPDDEPLVRRLGDLAIAAGVPLLSGRSLLAAPIARRDRVRLGGICLIDPPGRRRGPEEAAALRGLGERLAAELAFVSAHYRLVAEHEVLRESALLDPITGLWSRAGLEPLAVAAIAAARRRSEPIAVVVVDVHQLHAINERHGHIAGDAVLAHVGRAVRARVRASDLVGRAGPDEIAAILPATSGEQALALVEELTSCAGGAIALPGGGGVLVTLTGGAAAVADGEHGLEPVLARAAAALGRARAGGESSAMAEALARAPEDDEGDGLASGPGLSEGTTLGGMYRIRHELNRGAMGIVYRGDDLGLDRPVAIKVLRSDLAQNQDLLDRFRAEAAMLASLHHPNLVQVFAFGTEDDDVYFVMELVEGESLAEVMMRMAQQCVYIDLEVVEKIVLEIADAVDAMHAVGLIHRDVKPANILLDRVRDRAVLVDVGVAKRREERGDAAGTPGFAAPESFTDEAETPATDVYGLAATTYLMLTGGAPFGSGDVLAVLERQISRPPVTPSELRPELNDAIDSVLLKALAPAQLDRYGSASAFAIGMRSALRRVAQDRGGAAAAPPAAVSPVTLGGLTLERPRTGAQPRMVRGVVFRVAARVLGHHLGAKWLSQAAAQDPRIAEVLRADLPALGWQPIDRLVALLARLDGSPAGARLARAVGRGTASATFTRFFGGDPRSLSPGALLGAASAYWPRYHGWGGLEVAVGDSDCEIQVHGDPGHPLVCQVVAGTLGRIAELAGGERVTTQHPACVRTGAPRCRFHIRWQRSAGPTTAR